MRGICLPDQTVHKGGKPGMCFLLKPALHIHRDRGLSSVEHSCWQPAVLFPLQPLVTHLHKAFISCSDTTTESWLAEEQKSQELK